MSSALDTGQLDDPFNELDSGSLELLRRAVADETTGTGRIWTEHDISGTWLGEPVAPNHPGRFELIRCLGAGGFGAVYEARDHARGTRIAVKLLMRVKARDLFLFKQEFRGLTALHHPHLIELHELHADRGRWFFTMPLIEGVSFLDWVVDDEPLARPRLLQSAAQLARAIDYLHRSGRVHRDIKPSNVMVTPLAGEAHVVLLDFGLAAAPAEIGSGLVPGRGAGTEHYLAPENDSGHAIGPPADWYAFGVMLLEALTGRRVDARTTRASDVEAAISAASAARARSIREKETAELPVIRPSREQARLAGLTRKLLALDPAERPDGAAVLAFFDARPEEVAPAALLDSGPFVGRAAELATLARNMSVTDRSVVVLIRGPSGIGKTSLVEQALTQLTESAPAQGDAPSPPAHAPPLILRGRCYAEECVPYKGLDGVVDQLAHHLMALHPDQRAALRPRHARALVRLFPVLGAVFKKSTTDQLDPDASVLGLATRALCELLNALAQTRRIVIAIDDLQWGDADSALLLEALLIGPDAPRLAVLATLRIDLASLDLVPRPTGGTTHAPWLKQLLLRLRKRRSLVHLHEMELGPLSPADAETFAASCLGNDDPVASAALARAAHSVPYFVRALARRIMVQGDVGRDFSLVGLVLEHVRALPKTAAGALELVAVAGIPLTRRLLALAARRTDADNALDVLRRENLVRVDGVGADALVWARHDRIRHAVASQLSPERLCADYRALADAALTLGGVDPEALAFWLAQAGDVAAAIDPTIVAGRRALDVLSFERGANLYDRARSYMAPDDPRIAEVERGLADCEVNLGHMSRAAQAYLAAAARSDGDEALDLQRRAAECIAQTGDIVAAHATLRHVLRRLGVRRPLTGLGALLGWMRLGRRQRKRGLAFEPAAAADRSRRDAVRLDAMLSAGMLYSHSDFLRSWYFFRRGLAAALDAGHDERVGSFIGAELAIAAMRGKEQRSPWEEALVAAGDALVEAHPTIRARLAMSHAINAFCHGDWSRAAEMSERAEALSPRRRDSDVDIHLARIFGIEALYFSGRWRELAARLEALEANAVDSDGGSFFAGIVQLQTGWIRALLADDPKAAKASLERHVTRASALDRPQHAGRFIGHIDIALYASRGRGAAGREAYRATWPALRRSGMVQLFPLMRVVALANRLRVALAADDTRTARRAARALDRSETQLGHAWAAVARAHAAAGSDARCDQLSRAEVLFESRSMQLHVAAARWRRGHALVAAARHDSAGDADDGRGPALIEAAQNILTSEGIAEPERVVAMLLPGAWESRTDS